MGAASWLQGLSQGSTRDAAVGAFVGVVAHSDPATAAAWAASIGDDTQRQFRMESAARAWMDVDPSAARSWVQSSTLPADTKKRLLGPGG